MDCIIQAIKVIVGFKEKIEELVRIADIINSTITVITWQNSQVIFYFSFVFLF